MNDYRRITSVDARYIKHVGATIDVKVTFEILDGEIYARFRRTRTKDLSVALRQLQTIAETEFTPSRDEARP